MLPHKPPLLGANCQMARYCLAHTAVQCSVVSPCEDYVVFGTNFGSLYALAIDTLINSPSSIVSTSSFFSVSCGYSVHCLLSKNDHIWIGVTGCVLVIPWANIRFEKKDLKKIPLRMLQPAFEMPSVILPTVFTKYVNSLLSLEISNIIYAGCSDGYVNLIDAVDFTLLNAFKCHDQPIYSLSTAGPCEFLSCSEDGVSCFWDHRASRETWKPSLAFTPGDIPELQRPCLGGWLTVGFVQSNDPDWFVLGGGPKLSLWNKRAGRPTVILEPREQSPRWYPLVGKFVNAQVDPKIVAGGTSGCLIAWDFSGDLLYETCSQEDPSRRMTSILTIIEVPRKESDLAGPLLVGGLSPSIHLVSRIGYPSKHVKLADEW